MIDGSDGSQTRSKYSRIAGGTRSRPLATAAAALAVQTARTAMRRGGRRRGRPVSASTTRLAPSPATMNTAGLREPDGGASEDRGAQESAGRFVGIGIAEPERDERERHGRRDVGRVRLEFRAVAHQGRRQGEESRREHHDPRRLEPAREPRKEGERQQAARERDQAEGHLAFSEDGGRSLGEREEAGRRDLVEGQRFAQERRERPAHHVLGECDLVDPEGRVRKVLPEAKAGPDEQQGGHRHPRAAGHSLVGRGRGHGGVSRVVSAASVPA